MPKRYTEELQDIIRSMLYHDPSNRPSASRILRHPFIKKHIAIFLEGTKSRYLVFWTHFRPLHPLYALIMPLYIPSLGVCREGALV